MSSDITRKNDVLAALAQIHSEIEDEKQGMKAGLSAADLARQNLQKSVSQSPEVQTEAAKADEDSRKMLQQRPHLQGELYRIFLNRIRYNFHLVLQYSPSGSNFKEKITRHPELLYYSQVLFMRDLAAPELENLGVSFLKKQAQMELEKRLTEATNEEDFDKLTKPEAG